MFASSPRSTRICARSSSRVYFARIFSFRLNVVPLRLPPLRERIEDIPELVHHFLKVAVAEGLPQKYIEQAALDRMIRYRWPGNIPELQNLIRRLAALCPQEVITERFVELELECGISESLFGQSSSPRVTFATAIEPVLAKLFGDRSGQLPPPGLYHRVVREIEASLIAAALAATRGHQIKTAELLGLNRNTLRKKMNDLDIHPQCTQR